MRRFIITGTPGAGKTAIIRQLQIEGFSVVEETATDLIAAQQAKGIAEPWRNSSFIDAIAREQREREIRSPSLAGDAQFFDRSVVCTVALAVYLGYPVSPFLISELNRIRNESVYERQVFFIQNLGFIVPTEIRRITFEESLRFEKIHGDTYRNFGFELLYVAPGSVRERLEIIRAATALRGPC